ncbi:MAG: choice-of-anchor R domain-containing protein, partial [Methanobacteriota archaeon]
MSHRLRASGVVVLFLLAIAMGLLAATRPADGFGERPYESNPVISNGDLDVFRDQSVAQSFVATETYRVLNLTLRLRNTGSTTDALNVSVRPDAGGRPAATALDETRIVSGGATTLVDVPFAANPVLVGGARYWLVATHPGLLSDSYRWFHSNADSYADGWAMYNLNLGTGWLNVTPRTDMYFVTFGREDDAHLDVDLAVSPTEASWKGLVTVRVYYNNTGSLPAQRVWINASLPAGLTYVSDTASGSTTPFPSYTFDAVPNGVHRFDVTARVDVGVAAGASLVSSVTLEYRNSMGALKPGASDQASLAVGRATDSLYLVPGSPYDLVPVAPTGGPAQQRNLSLRQGISTYDFDLEPSLARPLRAFRADVLLYLDSDSGRPENLDINLTLLDANGGSEVAVAHSQSRVRTNDGAGYEPFWFSFAPFDMTFPTDHALRLRVRNMVSASDDAFLAINATATSSRVDVRTSTYVQVDAIDRRDARGPATSWSALDALVVRANVTDPLGIGRILGARINVTRPDGGTIALGAPMVLFATDASPKPSWATYEFAIGATLDNGTYAIEVEALGVAGTTHPTSTSATVRSPDFDLAIVPTQTNVRNGERFSYHVYINNTGDAASSRAWLNVTLPVQVTRLADSDPANRTGPSSWSWGYVSVGSKRLDIDVEVANGAPLVPFFRTTASLDFGDTKGHAWPAVAAFTDVAMNGPVIAFVQTPSPSAAHANESVTFTFSLDNTGDLAQTLWLNDTLPSGLEYVSNDAASIGGVTTFSGGAVRFLFWNLPAGTTWTFRLVARLSPGVAPGAVLVNVADLTYTNANGSLMPPTNASGEVAVLSPWLVSASITATPDAAVGGDRVALSIDFSNAGNEAATWVWLNVTLDPAFGFLDADRPASVTGGNVRFVLPDVAVGAHRVLVNVSVAANVDDGEDLAVTATADYRDAVLNPLPSAAFAAGSVRTSEPRFTLGVTPPLATVEAGGSFNLTVSHANAGSGTAGDA